MELKYAAVCQNSLTTCCCCLLCSN